MTSANPPVKHHYIPQFLLAQWAVNDGRLWRFLCPIPGKIATKPNGGEHSWTRLA